MKNVTEQPSLAVATTQPQAVAVAPQGISIEAAFNAVMTKDLDAEKLAVLKQLIAMNAEQQFNAAFVAMQADLPIIVAESSIPNRGKYQRYEDIMQKDGVAKILSRHKLSVSFDQKNIGGVITVTCLLRHEGGHSHPTSFSVRSGGKADSEGQADCKSSTTAKRNALCQALNITIRQDVLMDEENDASLLGNQNEFVTPKQAEELEHRAKMLNCDIPALFKFCRAESFATIPANKLDELDNLLCRKERSGK
jgi:hypothetical protein